jgi:ABC-type uncharacterized transport system substrate-binding protein
LLKEAVPSVGRVALLFNPASATAFGGLEALERSARGLNLTLQPIAVRAPGEIEGALSAMTPRQGDALALIEDWVIIVNARRVRGAGHEAASCRPWGFWSGPKRVA